MGPCGPHMGPYGPLWARMGPYGPCGTLIIPSPVYTLGKKSGYWSKHIAHILLLLPSFSSYYHRTAEKTNLIVVIEYREHSNNNITEQSCIENWKYYSQPAGLNLTKVSVPPNLDYDLERSYAGDMNSGPFFDFPSDGSESSSTSDSGFPPDFGDGFGELFGLNDPCNFLTILTDAITEGKINLI